MAARKNTGCGLFGVFQYFNDTFVLTLILNGSKLCFRIQTVADFNGSRDVS